MIKWIISTPSLGSSRRLKIGAWLIGVAIVVLLGFLRTATDAEFTFASAAIVPLIAISWLGGRNDGYVFSLLAAIMWAITDFLVEHPYSATWIPFANGLTRLLIYVFISYLIVHVKVLLVREKELSTHDELTTLLNRRAFFELGNAEVDRSKRYGHSMAVAFLDLDDFKQLNDTRGHKVGDLALKATAVVLRNTLRSTDFVARIGGDEFAVLLPETDFEAAQEAGEKVANAVNAAMKMFLPVSVSVGVSWFETANSDFSDMVASADSLMYEIKRGGKNGVQIQRTDSEEDR